MHKLLNKVDWTLLLNSKISSVLEQMSKDKEDTLGNMLKDEQPKDDDQIRKKRKGIWHTIEK